jgi:hypothetical protein
MSEERGSEIRRQRTLSDGVYIKGSVEGIPVMFTTDTGATCTVISGSIYNSIPEGQRPVLEKSSNLTGPGGIQLSVWGKAKFKLKLGELQFEKVLFVAEIQDDVLLGVDILQKGEHGPADIMLSRNIVILGKHEIPCIQIGTECGARRVTSADDFIIPAQSEAVIDVFVERRESDDLSQHCEFLIEPTEHFKETYPLQMAATLVDVNFSPTCKLRLLNPFPTPAEKSQNAILGQADAVKVTSKTLKFCEYDQDSENNRAIRKLDSRNGNIDNNNASRRFETLPKLPDHLSDLFEKSIKGLSNKEQMSLANLLLKYQDTFSKNEWDLGLTHLTEHPIATGDAAPVKLPPRRVPLAFANDEKKAIDDLLKMGVIRKSTSPWASPLVLVRKKSGAVRPCVDYRRVNALVKPDDFPLPRIQDCLDAVAGAKYFSTFDLTSGYFQIPLKESDIPKSAFVSKYGQYEMTKMPFGLNCAANTFQRTMELALQGLQWETCLIYIDDIVVFGATFNEHLYRVEQLLSRLSDPGLKLKPGKCELLQEEVTFLGHVVSGG